ncbi:hypothetical protein NFI96_003157 [Prochilodus magdalenae]|nr:hypothetical protein NFI96_003157 [Prochilodus magdalenae]
MDYSLDLYTYRVSCMVSGADPPAATVTPPPASSPVEIASNGADSMTPLPTAPPLACADGPCRNGGTCRPLSLPSGAAAFLCDCPLHFTGRLCEKGRLCSAPRLLLPAHRAPCRLAAGVEN